MDNNINGIGNEMGLTNIYSSQQLQAAERARQTKTLVKGIIVKTSLIALGILVGLLVLKLGVITAPVSSVVMGGICGGIVAGLLVDLFSVTLNKSAGPKKRQPIQVCGFDPDKLAKPKMDKPKKQNGPATIGGSSKPLKTRKKTEVEIQEEKEFLLEQKREKEELLATLTSRDQEHINILNGDLARINKSLSKYE